jgi:subtilisin-like proprotein convertase family protein
MRIGWTGNTTNSKGIQLLLMCSQSLHIQGITMTFFRAPAFAGAAFALLAFGSVSAATSHDLVPSTQIKSVAGTPADLVNQMPAGTEIAGDGDAFIETNEDWSLSIPLQNLGGSAATAIGATLSTSTPGVSLYSAASGYADIGAGGSAANDTPYVFHLDGGFACGQTIDFSLTVNYTGGTSPVVFNVSVNTGSPGTPITTSYSGTPVAIPDSAGANTPGVPAEATTVLAGIGPVYDLNLSIDGVTCSATAGSTTVGIDHTFVNDLQIDLLAPDGTLVTAINRTDGGGNNLCQTALDDQSAGPGIQSVVTAAAPFSGSFTPNQPLSAFNGKNADGDWILRATDFFVGDIGNIRAWSLTVTPAVCDAPVQPAQLSATKSVSGSAPYVEGQAITYTIVVTNSGAGVQPDNSFFEFIDSVPLTLALGTPTATSGTVSLLGINPVTWDGSLLPGASVTITIPATITAGTSGTTISNQGAVNFDTNRDGSNDSSAPSDDPATGAANDPTSIFVGQGQLTIAPAAIAFGDQGTNTGSAIMDATLGNSGTASLDVTALTAATAPFARVGGTCPVATPFAIAVGTTCTLSYQFTPTATGPFSQNISVSADAPGSGSFSLSGNGVQGMLSVSPSPLDFPQIFVGTSLSSALTIANTGSGALQVTSITAPMAPFSVAGGSCASAPFALAPSASCTIMVSFDPTTLGTFTQSLTIVSDAETAVVDLNGSAVAVPTELPTLSETTRLALGLLLFGITFVALRKRRLKV